DVGTDQVAEMADGEEDAFETLVGQLPHDDLEDRIVLSDRYERLGNERRVWPQPDALSACDDDRLTTYLRLRLTPPLRALEGEDSRRGRDPVDGDCAVLRMTVGAGERICEHLARL